MKRVIIGTAGHIDHGKTTLIKALTGRDTDRLPEEKQRGITIDLGFSYFELPDGTKAGIVDVPGHEKFIRNMLAGASGIDLVLLVIAADEGVMPQTKEHLHILELLGIKHGIVVITKIDMVEKDWLELVEEEIKEYLQGTFLEKAAIVEVSAVNGIGIEELKRVIMEEYQRVEGKNLERHFRLPIDRVFSVHGYGTVVTGTLISGKIRIGDEVGIYPKGYITKIRNLEVHDENVSEAVAGQRVAINLSSLKVDDLKRGMVVAPVDMNISTDMIDCKIIILDDSPFTVKNNQRIRLYIGSSEVMARASLINSDEIKQGNSGFCRLKLEEDVACERMDRFIIRSYSPLYTLGGGLVINPYPQKKKNTTGYENELKMLENATDREFLKYVLIASGKPLSTAELSRLCSLYAEEIKAIVTVMEKDEEIVSGEGYYVDTGVLDKFGSVIINVLRDFHASYPLKNGISKEELYSRFFKNIDRNGFDMMINILKRKDIIRGDNFLFLPDFKKNISNDDRKVMEKILSELNSCNFTPPSIDKLTSNMDMVEYMLEEGILIKIDDDIYITKETENQLKNVLSSLFVQKNEITVAEYRDALGISRKYALAYLEYFDKIRMTRRIGDVRILIRGEKT
ncbi:MAG: selenocysteine-specific translation elongation factor [Thermoanaerobacteraceae bacterium]|nr:selenocysteine-specific translation elongation factor [Thermoanaerobacteraceae bacterium]